MLIKNKSTDIIIKSYLKLVKKIIVWLFPATERV